MRSAVLSSALVWVMSVVIGALGAGCDDAAGCRYDSECPGNQVCLDGQCRPPPRCPEVPCDSGEVCINAVCVKVDCSDNPCGPNQVCVEGECHDARPRRHAVTSGGAVIRSTNYTLELFVAPENPVGSTSSTQYQIELGPGALRKNQP